MQKERKAGRPGEALSKQPEVHGEAGKFNELPKTWARNAGWPTLQGGCAKKFFLKKDGVFLFTSY